MGVQGEGSSPQLRKRVQDWARIGGDGHRRVVADLDRRKLVELARDRGEPIGPAVHHPAQARLIDDHRAPRKVEQRGLVQRPPGLCRIDANEDRRVEPGDLVHAALIACRGDNVWAVRVTVSARRPADVRGDVVIQLFRSGAKRAGFTLADHLARDVHRVVNHEAGHLSWLEPKGMKVRWAIVAALEEGDAEGARGIGAAVERVLNDRALRTVVLAPTPPGLDITPLLEGLLLRAYACDEFAPGDEFTSLSQVVVCAEKAQLSELRARIKEMQVLVRATNIGRRLADLPANIGTPTEIVLRARQSGGPRGLDVRSITEAQARRMGMGMFGGVAAGSGAVGRILVLEHNASRAKELPTLVFVGKGITHDTGGYNLKSGNRLYEQSYDKAGATAVIGAMHAIADLRVEAHVVALAPLVENCVDAKAMKPGDILTALDGTTVFIENTDAEGRLVMGDCLVYAQRFSPGLVVDLATLTHASHVALGDAYAALFSSDDDTRDLVQRASHWSGEELWPMPIHASHRGALRHSRAELANAADRGGGSCVAAAFLEHFTDFPWAHIDMAGKGLAGSERADVREGATGFGTRLLVRLAQLFAERERDE